MLETRGMITSENQHLLPILLRLKNLLNRPKYFSTWECHFNTLVFCCISIWYLGIFRQDVSGETFFTVFFSNVHWKYLQWFKWRRCPSKCWCGRSCFQWECWGRWSVDQKVEREEVDDVDHPLHRPWWWYIYYDECLSVCLFVTKNDHFLLGVSCNHLNPP